MKKISGLIFISLLCFVATLKAQHVEFGVKGGLNVSTFHSSAGDDVNSRASVYAGGLAHIHLSEHIAIQPELVYSSQGAKQDIGDNNYTWRLNYINVPVLFQYMVNNGFRLETGPQLGLLAGARVKSGGTLTDIKSSYTTADFAWGIGAGYLFVPTGLGIDARYNFGITNIDNTGSRDKLYNRVFQVGLFYQFRHH